MDADPERVFLTIEQPQASALYYTMAAKIDQHNRSRQADLGIERKLGTKDWATRVNLSLFSMIVVDTYLVHKQATNSQESPNEFYHKLAEEMIEYERLSRDRAGAVGDADALVTVAAEALGPRLTPTKRMRPDMKNKTPGSSGKKSVARHQGKCVTCKTMKTTWTCSTCRDLHGNTTYLCNADARKQCYREHYGECHSVTTNL